jgi:hypothetical protein
MNRSEGGSRSQRRERSALSPQPMAPLEPAWRHTSERAPPVVSTTPAGGLDRPTLRVPCPPARLI